MPYFFDVVDYDRLKIEDLIAHIDQFGEALFARPVLQKHAT